eukprot:COSAG04_NODE_6077_length_1416_cov_1.637813_2_plen_323_part_00
MFLPFQEGFGTRLVDFYSAHYADVATALWQEKARRSRRPEVEDTFRDDIELDPMRLSLWSIRPFDNWSHLAEGGFGKVFDLHEIAPPIEVGGRRFDRMVVKVPKKEGVAELKGEVQRLSGLEHEHIVQILGMAYCTHKGSEEEHWAMMLEYAESDLQLLLYGVPKEDRPGKSQDWLDLQDKVFALHSVETMVEFAEQIATGLAYIHGLDSPIPHLDLKPENVLLAKQEGKYIAMAQAKELETAAKQRKLEEAAAELERAAKAETQAAKDAEAEMNAAWSKLTNVLKIMEMIADGDTEVVEMTAQLAAAQRRAPDEGEPPVKP